MKKFLALVLALTMMLPLAACGGGSSSQPSEGTNSTSQAGTGGETSAETLTVWCWDPAFNIYAMKEAEKFYQKDHPNFKLNIVETPWQDLQTKLTTAATSGALDTLPDIFLIQNNALQKNIINFPELFYDLTDSGIAFDKFAQSAVAYSVLDGKNHAVPFDNGAAVTALRTDILEQAGFTIDDFTDITWEEYIAKGEVVLEKTGKPLLSTTAGEPDMIMIMLQSCGASLFNKDGEVDIVNNAALQEVIKVYTELVKKGIMIEVNNWDEYVGSFTNEAVAGTINGCWILGSVQTAKDQSGKWAVTNVPKLAGAAGATNYSSNGGSSWAVGSSSKNPELAIDFLDKTFGSNVAFYEAILPSTGAIANFLPAGDSDVYNQPQPFFGDAPIYSKIIDFAGKVPSNYTGAYYYEARDAVGVAITSIVAGADPATALEEAQSTVTFAMGQ